MKVPILLIAHGSKNKKFYEMVERAAEMLRELHGGKVVVGYLMGSPSIEEAVQSIEEDTFVVVPFFISESSHVVKDVKERVKKASNGKKVIYAKPLGDHPLVVRALYERFLEALQLYGEVPRERASPPRGNARSNL